MTLVSATVALLLLLVAAAPSLADADEFARHPPITCVAFESDEVDGANSLRLGRCLTAGDVICSSSGGWAFGIDPTDRMIKLWQGDRVSRNFFIRIYVLDRLFRRVGPAEIHRLAYTLTMFMAKDMDR